jgi:hypothetical protein
MGLGVKEFGVRKIGPPLAANPVTPTVEKGDKSHFETTKLRANPTGEMGLIPFFNGLLAANPVAPNPLLPPRFP